MRQITAKHILVEFEYEAKDIIRKLKEGEQFEKLASTFSTCPSGKRGGALGSFPRGRMVREFDKAAFALQPKEISAPVRTRFGYHIIKRVK